MLSVDEAIALQEKVAAARGETVGVDDPNRLRAVLSWPYASTNGLPNYPTLFNKVAVLMQGLIYHKPFCSSNADVAFRCAERILAENGYKLRADPADVERLTKGIELGITTWQRITVWLKRNTVREPAGSE